MPSSTVTTIWSRNTRRVETSTAPRYVAAGSGVARTRFRIPPSRRMTSVIASPPKVVFAQPYPSIPTSSRSAAGTPSIVPSYTAPSRRNSIGGNTKTNTADSRFRQNRSCCIRSSWRKSRAPLAARPSCGRPSPAATGWVSTLTAGPRRRGRGRRPRASAAAPRAPRALAHRRRRCPSGRRARAWAPSS